MDAIERWRESIPEESRVEALAGVGLVGVGLVAAAFTVARRRHGFFAWAIPGALLSAGIALIAATLFDVRNDRIYESQAAIENELASLDPIARAQVLKSVGEAQLRSMIPRRG